MKKLILLFSLFSIAFVSCKKSDTEETPFDCPELAGGSFEHKIVGCWQLVDWYTVAPIVPEEGEEAITDWYSYWDGCYKTSVLLLSDNHSSNMIYQGPRDNPNCWPSPFPGQFFTHDPWTIGFNETDEFLVFFQGAGVETASRIIELTDTRLVIDNPIVITGEHHGFLVFERP